MSMDLRNFKSFSQGSHQLKAKTTRHVDKKSSNFESKAARSCYKKLGIPVSNLLLFAAAIPFEIQQLGQPNIPKLNLFEGINYNLAPFFEVLNQANCIQNFLKL